MESRHIKTLQGFARAQSERETQPADRRVLEALEALGRVRLSRHFFMREFLYSEISAVHGIPNIPCDPELAIEAGQGLCDSLLEPLHRTFGRVVVRSAYRSPVVNAFGNDAGFNCGSSEWNRAKHIWDWRADDGSIGATACIVIPWFIDRKQYQENGNWRALAWYIHDHLPYSEMVFFAKNAAFNLNWHQGSRRRRIYSHARPKGLLTKPDADHNVDHSSEYPGFPEFQT